MPIIACLSSFNGHGVLLKGDEEILKGDRGQSNINEMRQRVTSRRLVSQGNRGILKSD